jgi:hypothetical protein
MKSQYLRKIFDIGSKFTPIKVKVDITQAIYTGATRVRYIRLPFGCKILGGRLMADGTLNTNKTVLVSQGYVTAGNVANLEDYLKPMTATEVTAAGVTVAVTTNPLLLTGAVATTLVPVIFSGHTNYIASGSAAESNGANTLRARANLLEGDVIIVSITAAGSTDSNQPVYHVELDLIPDYVETASAKLTEA